MGKFSLKNYEQYPTQKLRPALLPSAQLAPSQVLEVISVSPNQNLADLCATIPSHRLPHKPLLLKPSLSLTATNDIDEASAWLRRLGEALSGGNGLQGVVLDMGNFKAFQWPFLLQAWQAAFHNTFLVVPLANQPLIEFALSLQLSFGLLLETKNSLLSIRHALAANHLQTQWEKAPLFLLQEGDASPSGELISNAAFWRVAYANFKGLSNGVACLRRLTCPPNTTTGGYLPLRFWWDIRGNSPLYFESSFQCRLASSSGHTTLLPLQDTRPIRLPGDATHNHVAPVPALPLGEYQIQCGLFSGQGIPFPLGINAPNAEGWYTVGTITIDDTPRPEYQNPWQHYYPEGFYPLEDPKLPV